MIVKYKNGNTTVSILEDGTKIREYEGTPKILHPESIDVKITNYCDMGCSYCHESSTKMGRHANLDLLIDKLKSLPKGVELAIGGGNPLSHPDLVPFLVKLNLRGIISNITINQRHLKQHWSLIKYLAKEELVKGIGVSITHDNFYSIKELKKMSEHIVYHVIAGVQKVDLLSRLIKIGNPCKVLILGYKQFGRGINYYNENVHERIKQWYMYLPKYLGKCHLSFDNLAIEQLNIKRLFTKDGWDKFYMGDDFTHSMYVDAVEGQFAPTSRSKKRADWNKYELLDYFNKYRKT